MVSHAIHDAIVSIITDTLLTRARRCKGRGLELWRALKSEWEGGADLVVDAKVRRFQDPPRCSTKAQLWEGLPTWIELGEEVAMGGFEIDDRFKSIALDKLVPLEMFREIENRTDLGTYSAKLKWVRTKMLHAKSQQQAQAVATTGPKAKKDSDGDVDMGNLEQAAAQNATIASLECECCNKMAAGDLAGAEAILYSIGALRGSKGKGKGKGMKGLGKGMGQPSGKGWGFGQSGGGGGAGGGKGGGGKGGPPNGKGGPPGKGGVGGGQGQFPGACNHCGAWGPSEV